MRIKKETDSFEDVLTTKIPLSEDNLFTTILVEEVIYFLEICSNLVCFYERLKRGQKILRYSCHKMHDAYIDL